MDNMDNIDNMDMEYFTYNIKTSEPLDVITLFKTLTINDHNSLYIYTAMKNPDMLEFISEIIKPFLSNKISSAFYHIIDGWDDYWINKKIKDDKKIIKDILISFLRTDIILLEENDDIINYLKKEFDINYYAETMIG